AFALALSDELDNEVARLKTSGPRNDEQILLDALRRAEINHSEYMKVIDAEMRTIDQASILEALRAHETATYNTWSGWGMPLLHGVLSNFLWLFLCGLIVALSFAIEADWPSAVQSWFVGSSDK